MQICGKIFIINLYNLQMLFMVWIKNKFAECTNVKAPNGKLSGNGSDQARRRTGAFGGSYPKILFVPPKFGCAQKN